MIDLVPLHIQAGHGGHGRVSFRREKFIPKGGPDGGNGGRGGNIIVRVNPRLATLQHLSGLKRINANEGQNGGKKNMFGADGADVVIEVPPGTIIWLQKENYASERRRQRQPLQFFLPRKQAKFRKYYLEKEGELIPTLAPDELHEAEHFPTDPISPELGEPQGIFLMELHEGDADVILAQGGYGGRGNDAFKAPDNTTPLEAEYGTVGEEKQIVLELRLLADIGLVGFPNAGKSTLLSVLTNAKPKIANYPFTTLEPHLGIMSQQDSAGKVQHSMVIADIPGVIEGAHEGKGLGHTFLKHIEHCEALLFVVSLEDAEILDTTLIPSEQAEIIWQRFLTLRTELSTFSTAFLTKKHLLIINKMDLYSNDTIDAIKQLLNQKGEETVFISGYTGTNLETLSGMLWEIVDSA